MLSRLKRRACKAVCMPIFDQITTQIRRAPSAQWRGEIAGVGGMTLEAIGLARKLAVGDRCDVIGRTGTPSPCEVIGAREDRLVLMPLTRLDGVSLGSLVVHDGTGFSVRPCDAWRGRVVNALGEPIDGKGPLPEGEFVADLRATPPPPVARRRMGERISTGVRVMDTFTPLCRGQRMGVFAGSGVGKSSLLSMFARNAQADVNVIGLIGERGREVREFIERDLGEDGLARSILVVATSDEAPLMRRNAALLSLAVAEDQRKRGHHVFLMMDSVTRYAMALREIGLAGGEPPSTKGYPPSVFAELAALLERAGPGMGTQGDVSAIFTVLVEGGDMEEPIADAVRGILDGHVVLSRDIAERGRYPAVDALKSVSRALPDCATPYENELLAKAREIMALYADNEELIRIGAYKRGSDEALDEAIEKSAALEAVLTQRRHERDSCDHAFERLASALAVEGVETSPDNMHTTSRTSHRSSPTGPDAPSEDGRNTAPSDQTSHTHSNEHSARVMDGEDSGDAAATHSRAAPADTDEPTIIDLSANDSDGQSTHR